MIQNSLRRGSKAIQQIKKQIVKNHNKRQYKNNFIKIQNSEISKIHQKVHRQQHYMTQINSYKLIKKPSTTFSYQQYLLSLNQVEYIQNLLLLNMQKKKILNTIISMNQLNEILSDMKINLKIQQLHQLYLYSTYNKNQSLEQARQRMNAILNNNKKKIDFNSVAKWVHDSIKKGKIKFTRKRSSSEVQVTNTKLNRSLNQKQLKKRMRVQHKQLQMKLPPINYSSGEKLTDQLKYLVQIFEQMQKQRQSSGLIPMNLQPQQFSFQQLNRNIPYDPQLYDLNKNLAKLRIKAEDRLTRIIELARDQPKIRNKLQDAIQKFQKVRIQNNQKVGRIGSMKAQKRLIQLKKKQQNKINTLKLGEDQDLLKAAKLYALLSIQQKKTSKFIL